jgi:DNA-binding transcriptional LysR family regulator
MEARLALALKSGKLVEVLPQYRTPDAGVYAVWPQRHPHSTQVRACLRRFRRDILSTLENSK